MPIRHWPLLIPLLAALAPAPARAVDGRLGVWAAAGALGDRSTAGLEAAAAIPLRGRLLLDARVELGAYWDDVAASIDRPAPFVVGGPRVRAGVGVAASLLADDAPARLYGSIGVGPTLYRLAEADRADLVDRAGDAPQLADPAGWVSLTPYLALLLDAPLSSLLALTVGYELAVDRQLAPLGPAGDVDVGAWREPHHTALIHRLRLAVAVQPGGPVGFSVGVEPALVHGFVDADDAERIGLGTGRVVVLPAEPGIAFLVGAWVRL